MTQPVVPSHEGRARVDVPALVRTVSTVLLALIGGLVVLVGVLKQGPSGAVLYVDLLAGTLASVALIWRGRAPVVLALVLAVVAAGFATAGAANYFALFAVARRRSLAVALPIAVLDLAAALAFYALYPANNTLTLTVIVNVAIGAAVVAWGALAQARARLLESLRDRAERAEAEQRLRAESIRAAERARIAREMHDVVAHRVSLVALHAGGLQVRPDLPAAEVAQAADLIRASAQDALDELRTVLGILRADAPSSITAPRLAHLPDLVAESTGAGQAVELVTSVPADVEVPDRLGRDAYRVVQECLTNARKHAPGAPTTVTVAAEDGAGNGAAAGAVGLVVTVRNGRARPGAPPPLTGAGAGLVGLAERVGLSGGTLSHGPTAEGGYEVRAVLR